MTFECHYMPIVVTETRDTDGAANDLITGMKAMCKCGAIGCPGKDCHRGAPEQLPISNGHAAIRFTGSVNRN
jgi:hypothetical protein